jgi:hypothetical protein
MPCNASKFDQALPGCHCTQQASKVRNLSGMVLISFWVRSAWMILATVALPFFSKKRKKNAERNQ